MITSRRAVVSSATVFAVTILVVVSAVGVVSLVWPGKSSAGETLTASTSSTGTSSAGEPLTALVFSKSGLRLSITINSTFAPFQGSVLASVTEENPSARPVNVTAAGDWATHVYTWSDCGTNGVDGIAVLEGNYGRNNFSAVNGLRLDDVFSSCGGGFISIVYSYLFQPQSSAALQADGCKPGAPNNDPNGICGCGQSPCPSLQTRPTQTRLSVAVKKYFDTGYRPLPPGVYTVIGADEWGAVALLHFAVGNPGCTVARAAGPFSLYQFRLTGHVNVPGAWAIDERLNSTFAVHGEVVRVAAVLTNMANEIQTVRLGSPLLAGTQVLRSNGSIAWAYEPPGSVISLTTVDNTVQGQHISGAVDIPTSQLQGGQTYWVAIQPVVYDQNMNSLSRNLLITMELTVC